MTPGQNLQARARSYLHSNCAQCHVQAGGGNSQISLEFSKSLEDMKMLDLEPLHHKFDIPNARLVAPGNPARSVLLHRMATRDRGKMPQLATSLVDRQAVELIREWIRQDGVRGRLPGSEHELRICPASTPSSPFGPRCRYPCSSTAWWGPTTSAAPAEIRAVRGWRRAGAGSSWNCPALCVLPAMYLSGWQPAPGGRPAGRRLGDPLRPPDPGVALDRTSLQPADAGRHLRLGLRLQRCQRPPQRLVPGLRGRLSAGVAAGRPLHRRRGGVPDRSGPERQPPTTAWHKCAGSSRDATSSRGAAPSGSCHRRT